MQVIAKEIHMFWKLRSERNRDNMKVNDVWILPNWRTEVRKAAFYSTAGKTKACLNLYFTWAHYMHLEDHKAPYFNGLPQ